ncbi:MAG: DEAD/DEAH box helicase family protein [Thermoflexales bacterium]|nr:DEAD/DEAH box helicase family protein [Thermoflexales bacterium]
MPHLYELIQHKVAEWRTAGYPAANYPAIAEILDYALLPESTTPRLLRTAQLRALETYWYLRLVESTPHIFDLYRRYYPKPMDLLGALGLDRDEIKNFVLNEGLDALWDRVRTDDDFIKTHKLESVHETLTLDYPSYIMALAMGAGKTMLIGAIVATEFAMALEYPGKPCPFIQNALVFAPGLTILESLRELAAMPYDKLLPPRLYQPFEVTYKLVFTREGEKDLPVIRGSRYNLIVTNTEKIRIQKQTRRHASWTELYYRRMLEQAEEEANLRLRAIASLPNLGIFSDEAHHTYGREIGTQLKRVRQTVNYLHEQTDLICVVNTTGTPYYERQPLRDVVIWYGLSEGIRDGILKPVDGSIYAYDFDNKHADQFVAEVVRDFFQTYGEVRLPNGAPARLAMYFPQTKDLQELRPVVEQTLMELGYSTDAILRNTSQSTQAEVDAFNRLNDPASHHRVILLVNKGTEGWDCPSLFACALARQLKHSQNFVLQASTRCLRQVPGNVHKGRIYLSMDNRGALDRQLQETYGETIADLNQASQNTHTGRLVVRKLNVPPLVIKKIVRQVVSQTSEVSGQTSEVFKTSEVSLERPDVEAQPVIVKKVYTPQVQAGTASVLSQIDEERATYAVSGLDLYSAATELAAVYRLNAWGVYAQLKRLYGAEEAVPEAHLPALAAQVEAQTRHYRIEEEEVEVALALIKPDGFTPELTDDGNVVYTAEITYQKSKEHLLLSWQGLIAHNQGDLGFHYDPYNFDSGSEKDFFTQMLSALNLEPGQVEDIYFTGGLNDPRKTDFYVEYKGVDGKWHRYSPDFIIRRKDGRCYIVEIKMERLRDDAVDGQNGRKAMAIQQWVGLNPDLLKYEMIFSGPDSIAFNQLEPVKQFVQTSEVLKTSEV